MTRVILYYTHSYLYQVRGAPAIGVVGSLSLAVELQVTSFPSLSELETFVADKLEYLVSARPTAVNMADCRDKLTRLVCTLGTQQGASVESVKAK